MLAFRLATWPMQRFFGLYTPIHREGFFASVFTNVWIMLPVPRPTLIPWSRIFLIGQSPDMRRVLEAGQCATDTPLRDNVRISSTLRWTACAMMHWRYGITKSWISPAQKSKIYYMLGMLESRVSRLKQSKDWPPILRRFDPKSHRLFYNSKTLWKCRMGHTHTT